MFTGIIETTGKVVRTISDKGNLHLIIQSSISTELKIDQSVSHNGVCLTVVNVNGEEHTVTAIDETLNKTNIGNLTEGDLVNLERCTRVGDRLDGHIVQGHVDQTGICTERKELDGSWLFTFRYQPDLNSIVVEKGSVCVNGVSLTAFNSAADTFSVAIIPYTYQHTNFSNLKEGDRVNLEFDIVGKYIARMMQMRAKS